MGQVEIGIAVRSMSALGQKRTSRSEIAMSALPPKADIGGESWMSALCQKRTHAPQQSMCGLSGQVLTDFRQVVDAG